MFVCKQFSICYVSTYGLLASQRRPFGLQKVPFKTLTNALLKSNKASFTLLFYNGLIFS